MKANINDIVRMVNVGTYSGPVNFDKIANLAKENHVAPAENDNTRVLLVGIDFQYCFIEDIGSLGVAGSKNDVRRTIAWLYRNCEKVTRVMLSADDHTLQQIFFPCWWSDKRGNNPDPYTIITHDDVACEVWIPNYDKMIPDENNSGAMISYCQEYVRHLEEGKRQKLQIWPYHATSGTFDSNIEAQLSAMVYYHARCRHNDPFIARKGTDPWSEMYSLIKPEWSMDGYINKPVLNEFAQYDIIVFTGEAASHCAGLSVLDTAEYFAQIGGRKPQLVVLRDCMSPIPGFEDSTEELYKTLQDKYGVLVTKSKDFVL